MSRKTKNTLGVKSAMSACKESEALWDQNNPKLKAAKKREKKISRGLPKSKRKKYKNLADMIED